eukprot:CAMPEP_0202889952 /NCGR_PEP_ID=MMETSP1392-20130828/483_1 /ASSEMBLY_ACC=CAM_ASM_000868 /TAXON_ID=225041 /ORGANISM="Chlamydomonas chlamydogama, Strain SAG 11-48b" /LENGTH=113 /DNA_ID=CAMNT_0049573405 /DNA_START=239 /DNA_END=577 /DNA_ORIENTATION=+
MQHLCTATQELCGSARTGPQLHVGMQPYNSNTSYGVTLTHRQKNPPCSKLNGTQSNLVFGGLQLVALDLCGGGELGGSGKGVVGARVSQVVSQVLDGALAGHNGLHEEAEAGE